MTRSVGNAADFLRSRKNAGRPHRCFGLNDFGQLGQGDTDARGQSAATMGDNLGAVDLGTGAIVVDMDAGSDHTCVVLDQGDVKVIWSKLVWRFF